MESPNAPDTVNNLAPQLTPRGHLLATAQDDAPPLAPEVSQALGSAFALGSGHGLLLLGTAHIGRILPPAWAWWRDVAARYVTALCATPDGGEIAVELPTAEAFEALVADAPPMTGAEYLTPELLAALWHELDAALRQELAAAGVPLQAFLKSRHPAWNLVGRVHFNLAENRKDAEAPFAFLATYTARLSAHGKAQHQPLSQALAEFSGGKSRAQLLSLLLPVQRAAEHCDWLREMVEVGDIYHPLRWTALDACRFLTDLPQLEAAGISVRTPGVWKAGRPPRPVVKASVGTLAPSLLGQDALLDFSMQVCLDGEDLSDAEVEALLQSGDGLQFIRGRWVEVDQKAIGRLLERFKAIEEAAENGLPFAEAMRLVAGASLAESGEPLDADWSELAAGPWLADTLAGLRKPEGLAHVDPGPELKATLRPYQQAGVRWLYLLTRLGLGACLADDMGLGKTIQVLSLLLVLKRENAGPHQPSLLVAPASLLANWAADAERFAPGLRLLVVHRSTMPYANFKTLDAVQLAAVDLVITSYDALLRQPVLQNMRWCVAVVDEAQAIKNPRTKQTRQVKQLQAKTRIALTGIPVENRLSDLWSIVDFTHPGLLGSDKVFTQFTKRLAKAEHFGPLRALVQPYILRRLKTDKRVISDLPDKTELKAWCFLRPRQATFYQHIVNQLAAALEDAEGAARVSAVESFLFSVKWICNHVSPLQSHGGEDWKENGSGKLARLRELAAVIAARQEKLLVFTQSFLTTEPVAEFLGAIFGREGLVLHEGTPVAKRHELVNGFQTDEQIPFLVLSLKAGGVRFNLTAASHVIHFDPCWNPAVEDQATDQAFHIGQQRNVLVHRFICRGTIEERIDRLIESRKELAKDMPEGGVELLLTEMGNSELLDLVKLDFPASQEN